MTNASFTLNAGDLSPTELQQALNQLSGTLDSELRSAARDIGQRIRGDAADKAPVDTGQLASSIEAVVEGIGSAIIGVRVGSNLPQAPAQEFGTEPHFPPPSALRGWARRVLGDPDAAYAVAQSIAESGTEAQPFLEPAFEETLVYAADRVHDAVSAAFDEVGLT